MADLNRTLNDLSAGVLAQAGGAAVAEDPRPRFLLTMTPAGMRRVRRMPGPQLFTQIANFERLKLLERPFGEAEGREQRQEIARFIQRCVVLVDADVLAWPGYRGLQTVLTWSPAVRAEIAATAAAFMEI